MGQYLKRWVITNLYLAKLLLYAGWLLLKEYLITEKKFFASQGTEWLKIVGAYIQTKTRNGLKEISPIGRKMSYHLAYNNPPLPVSSSNKQVSRRIGFRIMIGLTRRALKLRYCRRCTRVRCPTWRLITPRGDNTKYNGKTFIYTLFFAV